MKPQDFFIGLRDFFSVLVPGVVFLTLLPPLKSAILGANVVEAAFAFAIAAYIVGSVAASLGAGLDWIIDPAIEHPLRKRVLGGRLEERRDAAEALRLELLEGCSEPLLAAAHIEKTKGFWWDHLRLNCDVAIAELDRLEASQKLFRSLVATFLLLALAYSIPRDLLSPALAQVTGFPSERSAIAIFSIAAFLSAILYAGRRYLFLTTLYRLAGAYGLKGCSGTKAGAPPRSA